MTTRHLLDRAILRACNRDSRLLGVWDFLPFLDGNEREIAYQVSSLGGCDDSDQLARKFLRSRNLEEMMAAIEALDASYGTSQDDATDSLF